MASLTEAIKYFGYDWVTRHVTYKWEGGSAPYCEEDCDYVEIPGPSRERTCLARSCLKPQDPGVQKRVPDLNTVQVLRSRKHIRKCDAYSTLHGRWKKCDHATPEGGQRSAALKLKRFPFKREAFWLQEIDESYHKWRAQRLYNQGKKHDGSDSDTLAWIEADHLVHFLEKHGLLRHPIYAGAAHTRELTMWMVDTGAGNNFIGKQ